MTDTIRLSDRVTLQPDTHSDLIRTLEVDGEHAGIIHDTATDALIAACNPPRYDLPPGVEPGYVLKAGTPLPVGWEAVNSLGAWETGDAAVSPWDRSRDHVVRPTAANPLQPLPDHTFRLPDGELACYRRDAAKLRESGAVVWFSPVTVALPAYDARYPDQVLLVEFPAPPKTDVIPLEACLMRMDATLGRAISAVDLGTRMYRVSGVNDWIDVDENGHVEVLATDGAL